VKTYYVRFDPGDPHGGAPLEVAIDDSQGSLRIEVVAPDGTLPKTAKTGPRLVDLAEVVPGCYSLLIDGRSHTLSAANWGGPHPGVGVGAGGGNLSFHLLLDAVAVTAEVGRSKTVRRGAGTEVGATGQVRAPMPGLVVAIQAGPGTAVVAGQALIIMEAMKMHMEIRAPHAGVVRAVHVAPGQEVPGNELLATVD